VGPGGLPERPNQHVGHDSTSVVTVLLQFFVLLSAQQTRPEQPVITTV
jgi:hypothetical protein